MSKAKIASDVHGVRDAAAKALKAPHKSITDVGPVEKVSSPHYIEHPEKFSRAPKSPNGKEDRREASKPGESGATQLPGKSRESDGVLRFPAKKPETVRTVDITANKGAALKAGLRQRTTADGSEASNPKHRTRNSFGVPDGTK
jgi:hypothetical protein